MAKRLNLLPSPSLSHSIGIALTICFLASHPLQSIISTNVKFVYVALGVLLISKALLENSASIPTSLFWCISLFMLLGFAGSIVSGTYHQIQIIASWAFMAVAIRLNIRILLSRSMVNCLVYTNILILFGALLGFLYALLGGPVNFEVMNQETLKPIYYYIATFTNSVNVNIIRPSGVFDEPGALAMFSIIVASLNELRLGYRKYTVLILVLNCITLSMMAMLALLAFIILVLLKEKRTKAYLTLAITVLGMGVMYSNYSEFVHVYFLDRVAIVDGNIVSNNRSIQVARFFDIVNSQIILNGNRIAGMVQARDQSSNPFSILFSSGVFVWLPYILILAWLIKQSLSTSTIMRFVSIVLVLVLLQRPYVFSLYWAHIILVLLYAIQCYIPKQGVTKSYVSI